MVKDITDVQQWRAALPGLNRSIDGVFGHYVAVDDWFLYQLNDVSCQVPHAWQAVAVQPVGEGAPPS